MYQPNQTVAIVSAPAAYPYAPGRSGRINSITPDPVTGEPVYSVITTERVASQPRAAGRGGDLFECHGLRGTDLIALPAIPPATGPDAPRERFSSADDLDARLAGLPPSTIIISYSRTTSRHTSREGCVRGTVEQIRLGQGERVVVPATPADLGWCWVSGDGHSGEIRAVWVWEH